MKRLLSILFLLFVSNQILAQNYITLYSDCNYRGTATKLYTGRYTLNSTSVGANSVSSIRIPYGFKVVIYDGDQPGTGNKIRYTSDMSCLPRDWNDRAVSVVVEADNTSNNNNNNNNNNNSGGGNNNRFVMIYSNCQYGGNSRSYEPGSYNTSQLAGVGNDQISSIQIPSGWQIIVYADDNWRGASRTYYSSISCVDNSWNDRISSFRIYSNTNNYNNNNYNGSNNNGYDDYPSRNDGITVFEDCYYAGRHYVLRPGRYDSREMGIGNDRISSLKVPSGYRIIAYGDGGFSGGQREFFGDVNCLGHDWNDKISSIEVIKGSGGGYNNNNNNNNNNYYPSDNAGVTFYERSWFSGHSRSYGTGNNEFYNDNLDKNVSSIKIESGYTLTVWDEPGYRGNRYTFTASAGNLNFNGWNDRIRSFSIRRN